MDHIDSQTFIIIDEELISIPFCFNNRKYDNHLLNPKCTEYNLSYTDIYDFCQKKQSLKKMFVNEVCVEEYDECKKELPKNEK